MAVEAHVIWQAEIDRIPHRVVARRIAEGMRWVFHFENVGKPDALGVTSWERVWDPGRIQQRLIREYLEMMVSAALRETAN